MEIEELKIEGRNAVLRHSHQYADTQNFPAFVNFSISLFIPALLLWSFPFSRQVLQSHDRHQAFKSPQIQNPSASALAPGPLLRSAWSALRYPLEPPPRFLIRALSTAHALTSCAGGLMQFSRLCVSSATTPADPVRSLPM
ncbi:MAG: hypothetical protein V8S31_03990 [Lachnospiraceae bacterium]